MKKLWVLASLVFVSANVLGGDNGLFFGSIECKNNQTNVRYAPLSSSNPQVIPQNEHSAQSSDTEFKVNEKATQELKRMLGVGQPSIQNPQSNNQGEYIAFLTYNLQEKSRQIQENNEQIALLLRQIQESSEQNVKLQKLVKEKESLQLGNALLNYRNRKPLAENAWLQKQLRKNGEFSSSEYNRKN